MTEVNSGVDYASRRRRALALLSGGLDSQLAVCLLRDQGVEVVGLVFHSPFFSAARGEKAAAALALPLIKYDFTREILALLRAPRHGFGAGLNPCIDCHAAMIRCAGEIMRAENFDFIATGEVLNQRPMSQTRAALEIVARESGCAEFLLRPLSAKLLPPTRPEMDGLLDRQQLLGISGRSRKPQLALARHYGLIDVPQSAGGCMLTEKNYGRKLRDLRDHEGFDDLIHIRRLNIGRHFRLRAPAGSGCRLIVGRNQTENDALFGMLLPGELVLTPAEIPGPVGVLSAGAGELDTALAAKICARYSDFRENAPVKICVRMDAEIEKFVFVQPAAPEEIEPYRIA